MKTNKNQKSLSLEIYLKPSVLMDYESPEVKGFIRQHLGSHPERFTPREIAVKLYYAVRDSFWYDPYHIDFSTEALKASALIRRGYGFCVEKANLLSACCRACGIPARLGFANVRNHIGTEKFYALLKTDVMVFHGYSDLFIEGKWVKATPAFNKELCQRLNVDPLEFDGMHDSLFQQYDRSGNKYMDYLHDYGTFAEFPVNMMISELKKYYPHLFEGLQGVASRISWKMPQLTDDGNPATG